MKWSEHKRVMRKIVSQTHQEPERDDDGLNAARGFLNGIAISACIWAVIIVCALAILPPADAGAALVSINRSESWP